MRLSPRWKKVARDLLAHKTRTALVVASIAVGVFAVLAVLGGRAILLDTFSTNFPRSNAATAEIFTSDFSTLLVDRVARQRGISGAEGRRAVTMRYVPGDETTAPVLPSAIVQATRAQSLQLTATDWNASSIARVIPDSGVRWPPRRGDIVIERSARLVGSFPVGSLITVQSEDGSRHVLRVSGYALDINALPAMFSGQIGGYVSMQTIGDLGQPQDYNDLLVTMPPSGLTRAEASRRAASIRDEVIVPGGVQVYGMNIPEPGSHFLGDIFKALALLLVALGVMALLLSAFLVVNTVSALVTQQTKQVGIMKAVGARERQVVTMYLTTVAVYGLLAVVIAVPLGIWMASWFASFVNALLNFGNGATVPPAYTIALAVLVGVVAPLAAAWFPVRNGARTSVAAALSATGMSTRNFGHGLVDRLLARVRGLPRPVALALRNTFLSKGRLALTLITLVLASAVIMAVASVQTSIDRTVADIGTWWNHDVEVTFATPVPSGVAQREALKVNGVTGVESWIVLPTTLDRRDGTENSGLEIVGLPETTDFIRPSLVSGRWLRAAEKDTVVVNTDVVNDEHLIVGDTIELTVRGVDHSYRVVGVVSGQLLGSRLYTGKAGLERVLNLGGGVTELVIRTASHTRAEQDAASGRIEQRLKDAGLPVSGVRTSTVITGNVASELGILVTVLGIMAIILAAVGVIGLMGTMIINVLESTREIGVMRAVGAGHASIYQVYVAEGFVVGMLSHLGGLVLSWPMSYALVRVLEGAMGVPLAYEFSWLGVAEWLGIVAVISVIASLLPAYRASQVSVRDAIAYE